jgi:hypothetical protein
VRNRVCLGHSWGSLGQPQQYDYEDHEVANDYAGVWPLQAIERFNAASELLPVAIKEMFAQATRINLMWALARLEMRDEVLLRV